MFNFLEVLLIQSEKYQRNCKCPSSVQTVAAAVTVYGLQSVTESPFAPRCGPSLLPGQQDDFTVLRQTAQTLSVPDKAAFFSPQAIGVQVIGPPAKDKSPTLWAGPSLIRRRRRIRERKGHVTSPALYRQCEPVPPARNSTASLPGPRTPCRRLRSTQ